MTYVVVAKLTNNREWYWLEKEARCRFFGSTVSF